MPPDLEGLQGKLSAVVGAEQVRAGPAAADLAIAGVAPRLAVWPGSQEQVEAAVAACAAAGAAVACRGGGTTTGTGNPPSRLDVVLCLDRLTRVVEFDAPNLNVSVEAGVRLGELQALLAERREFLPLDPPHADRVTVGGLVAGNASGPTRLLYGSARDWILGLRVVLPTGERIRCGGKVIKNVSGYDMNKLFIGSMGTLGVVTEATFKLLPLPARRATVVAVFGDLPQAAAVVERALASQLLPEAMEALDPQAVRAIAADAGFGAQGYGLAVSVAGSEETVERQVRDFGRFFAEAQAIATASPGEGQAAAAWRAIRDVHAQVVGASDGRVVVRIAVPVGKTLELLASAERLARRLDLRRAITAHAGSGLVRAAYLVGGGAAEALREGLEVLRAHAESLEGSLVVEAVPPALRRSVDAWGKPRQPLSVMRRLKREFDPQDVMSPGRFVGGI